MIGWNIDFEVSYQMPADTAKCPLKGDTSDQRLAKHVAKLNKDRRDMETQRRRLDSTKDIEKVATAVYLFQADINLRLSLSYFGTILLWGFLRAGRRTNQDSLLRSNLEARVYTVPGSI